MVFALDMEHWTSSTPSVGSLRVRGSLPNQSTCVLWIWRRHSTTSLVESSGAVLRNYGGSGPFIRAVCSRYNRSRRLVRIASSKLDSFPVRFGLCQHCPLLPILFITFIDRISRRSHGVEGVRVGDFRIGSLLFADDVDVLLAPSARDLQFLLD